MKTLDENTPVQTRLGLVVLLVTACVSLIAGTVTTVWWWASWSSKVDTQLSSIVAGQQAIMATNNRNGERIDEMERRVTKLEAVGSPHLQQLQKDVAEMLRQFEIHRVQEGARKP